MVGYSVATDAFGGLYGTKQFLMLSFNEIDYRKWVPVFISCWHCVSVASCSLSERTRTSTHNALAVLISTCVFPIVASWSWGGGWLDEMNFIDNAGAGTIHLVGGTIGLVGSWMLGPRLGFFNMENMIGIGRSLNLSREKD